MKDNHKIEIDYTLADGEIIQVQVTEAVAKVLKEFDRKETALKRQDRRHLDLYGNPDVKIYHARQAWQESPEDEIMTRLVDNQLLYDALQNLTQTQRERIYAYFFKELSLEEIAEKEGIYFTTIQQSISSSLKSIYELFVNNGFSTRKNCF